MPSENHKVEHKDLSLHFKNYYQVSIDDHLSPDPLE